MDRDRRRRVDWIVGCTAIVMTLAATIWVTAGGGSSTVGGGWDVLGTGEARASASVEREVQDSTLTFFEERYREDPGNPIAAAELIDGYRRRFRTEARLVDLHRAEELAEEMVRVALDRAGFLGRLATIRLDLHEFPGAYRAAREAAEADASSAAAQGSRFDAAWATGRYSVAESALARLPAGSFAHRFREARWLEAHGRVGEAVRVQRRACSDLSNGASRSATVSWCLTRVAELEGQRSGSEAAAELYRRALAIHPGYRAAVEGLADLAYVRRDWEEAEELYRRILTDAHPDLHLRLAEVLDARGQDQAASAHEQAFRTLATDSTSEALFARPLALHLAEHGSGDRALSLIRRDLERRPVPAGFEALAWIHLQRGEPQQALEASNRARSMDAPGNPGATSDYHRARILEALGRDSEAREMLETARSETASLAPHALQDLWNRTVGESEG